MTVGELKELCKEYQRTLENHWAKSQRRRSNWHDIWGRFADRFIQWYETRTKEEKPPLPFDRDELGLICRKGRYQEDEDQVGPFEDLSPYVQEGYRRMGEAVARHVIDKIEVERKKYLEMNQEQLREGMRRIAKRVREEIADLLEVSVEEMEKEIEK